MDRARRGKGVVAVAVGLVLVGLAVGVALTLSAARHRRPMSGDERGASDNSFMKGVVKVSLIVMLVAGGIVWLVDRAEDNPPDSGSGDRTPQHQQRDRDGGGKNR
jgi:hypothetical protein